MINYNTINDYKFLYYFCFGLLEKLFFIIIILTYNIKLFQIKKFKICI